MPAERFYFPQDLVLNNTIQLEDKEFHHLAHVMRGQMGDVVEIVNGRGALAKGTIERIEKRSCNILIQELQESPLPQHQMILAQALPRPQKLDDILEKGTELGVTEFWLFPGKFSDRKELSESQSNRLQHITISALKQCGRVWLPKITFRPPLTKWDSLDCPLYFGDLDPEASLFSEVWAPAEQVAFCVGPESGLDPEEVAQLKALGGQGVKLNPNILRTETAAIVGIGLISHWLCS